MQKEPEVENVPFFPREGTKGFLGESMLFAWAGGIGHYPAEVRLFSLPDWYRSLPRRPFVSFSRQKETKTAGRRLA